MAECSICKNTIQVPYELNCCHSFHKACIKQLKRQGKMCPCCSKPILKKHYSGYELFTLTDGLECQICNWRPLKLVTLSDSSFKVEYVFNHHCDACQFNCHYFQRASSYKDPVKLVRANLKPKDESFSPFMGLPLDGGPTREYDKYDYLHCNKCHQDVLRFHDQDIESLEKRSPEDYVFARRMYAPVCSECKRMTWGTLLEKTYQNLPKCGICNKIVKRDDWFRRFCCRSTPFHFDCSLKHPTCPKCGKECKISFDISRSDPTMQNITLSGWPEKETNAEEPQQQNHVFSISGI